MKRPRTNEARTIPSIPSHERPRRQRWLGAATVAAALLVATPVAAHSGPFGQARGGVGGPADGTAFGSGYGTAMHGDAVAGRHGGMRGGTFGGLRGGTRGGEPAPLTPMALQRLPLGTEVAVEVYDADPAEGARPVTTLTATVGETSEVAFADEVRAATAEAAFVSVVIGPRTVRVALDGAADPRRAPLAGQVRVGALERGQTVEIAFYEGADDAAPSTTATFTYGEDSAAAFHERVARAAAQAAVAEVALPAQERTIDLSADRRYEGRAAAPRPGYGMGTHVDPGAGQRGAMRPGAMRPRAMQRGAGFGPWATPSDPSTDPSTD